MTEIKKYYRATYVSVSQNGGLYTMSFRADSKVLARDHAECCARDTFNLRLKSVKYIGTDVPNVGDFGEFQRA